MVVPIADVTCGAPVSRRTVARMRAVLECRGQIEPLQVWRDDETGLLTTFEKDPWGAEIIEAAKELGWPTLLIVEMARYQG